MPDIRQYRKPQQFNSEDIIKFTCAHFSVELSMLQRTVPTGVIKHIRRALFYIWFIHTTEIVVNISKKAGIREKTVYESIHEAILILNDGKAPQLQMAVNQIINELNKKNGRGI